MPHAPSSGRQHHGRTRHTRLFVRSLELVQETRRSFAPAAHAKIEDRCTARRSVLPQIGLMILAAAIVHLHLDRCTTTPSRHQTSFPLQLEPRLRSVPPPPAGLIRSHCFQAALLTVSSGGGPAYSTPVHESGRTRFAPSHSSGTNRQAAQSQHGYDDQPPSQTLRPRDESITVQPLFKGGFVRRLQCAAQVRVLLIEGLTLVE
jgi:hypothetical protein